MLCQPVFFFTSFAGHMQIFFFHMVNTRKFIWTFFLNEQNVDQNIFITDPGQIGDFPEIKIRFQQWLYQNTRNHAYLCVVRTLLYCIQCS